MPQERDRQATTPRFGASQADRNSRFWWTVRNKSGKGGGKGDGKGGGYGSLGIHCYSEVQLARQASEGARNGSGDGRWAVTTASRIAWRLVKLPSCGCFSLPDSRLKPSSLKPPAALLAGHDDTRQQRLSFSSLSSLSLPGSSPASVAFSTEAHRLPGADAPPSDWTWGIARRLSPSFDFSPSCRDSFVVMLHARSPGRGPALVTKE